MDFFKNLKEDIGTAVGELTSDDDQMVDTLGETDFDEFDLSEEDSTGVDSDMLEKIAMEESLLSAEKEDSVPEVETPVFTEPVEKENMEEKIEEKIEEKYEEPEPVKADENTLAASANNTVISEGTVINGSIISDGSLEILGTVNGDITCLGKLSIVGKVSGKSSASEVYVNSNRLDGGIVSKGSVKVDVGTIVIGDISGTSCVIAGAVKGDIDINGPVIVDSTAVVKGNINSKGIQINNGAVIDGFCSLPYSSVDIDSFFGEEV